MAGAAPQHAASAALPSLAIIVPLLNESAQVPALIESLLRIEASERIVVDGGSTDGTVERLRDAPPGLRVVTSPRGRAVQMNHGAALAQAEVLLFLHADTLIGAGHVQSVRGAIAMGADFGCFALRIDSDDPRLRLASWLISLRSRLLTSATGDQALFIRRSLFAQLGGYRELSLCEDLDLVSRAARHGRFTCLPLEVLTGARRWERKGIVRTILLMWLLRIGCHAGIDPQTLKRFYEDVR